MTKTLDKDIGQRQRHWTKTKTAETSWHPRDIRMKYFMYTPTEGSLFCSGIPGRVAEHEDLDAPGYFSDKRLGFSERRDTS